LRDFEDLHQQVDRLAWSALGAAADVGPWLPAGDVSETDDAYMVEIELPGVRREDSLTTGVLTVRVPKMNTAKPNKIKIAGS
jgi:HSP20 family molecular chaperone IbpA